MACCDVDFIRRGCTAIPGDTHDTFAHRYRRPRCAYVDTKHGAFDRGDEIGRPHLEMSDISFFDAEQNPSEGLEYRRAQRGWFDLAQFGLTAGRKFHDADATGRSHRAVRAGPYLRRKQQGVSDRNRLPLVVAVTGSALFDEPRYLDRAPILGEHWC